MHFLDARGPRVRYAQVDIAIAQEFADSPAALAGERDDGKLVLVGGVDRLDDVGRVAGRRDREEDVAAPADARTCLAKTCSNE